MANERLRLNSLLYPPKIKGADKQTQMAWDLICARRSNTLNSVVLNVTPLTPQAQTLLGYSLNNIFIQARVREFAFQDAQMHKNIPNFSKIQNHNDYTRQEYLESTKIAGFQISPQSLELSTKAAKATFKILVGKTPHLGRIAHELVPVLVDLEESLKSHPPRPTV